MQACQEGAFQEDLCLHEPPTYLVSLLEVLFEEDDVFVVHVTEQVNFLEDVFPAVPHTRLYLH